MSQYYNSKITSNLHYQQFKYVIWYIRKEPTTPVIQPTTPVIQPTTPVIQIQCILTIELVGFYIHYIYWITNKVMSGYVYAHTSPGSSKKLFETKIPITCVLQ